MSETFSDEEERRRKEKEEKKRARKAKEKEDDERRSVVIVQLADAVPVLTNTGNAADIRADARRAAVVLATTLIEWIIKMILALSSSLHFPIVKIPRMILVPNRYKELAAKKLTNAHTVVLYFEEKEVLWLLSYRTESNLVSLVVAKSD